MAFAEGAGAGNMVPTVFHCRDGDRWPTTTSPQGAELYLGGGRMLRNQGNRREMVGMWAKHNRFSGASFDQFE